MKDTHLSENQEDKLVSLRTLHEGLYTTICTGMSNLSSKCECVRISMLTERKVINSLIYCAD